MARSAKRRPDCDQTQECATRKKQRPSDEFKQNTDLSNDVIRMAGVDLEEEQVMLSWGGRRAFAPSQEKGRMILQKSALHTKLQKIMSKCGIESRSKDVEHCLSLCVEERLHGLISKLIKMSKQKRRLSMLLASEFQGCCLVSNYELWKKVITRDRECRGEIAASKDINSTEPSQENETKRIVGEILRSANAAARAAMGGDDITLKWKSIDKSESKKNKTCLSSHHDRSTEIKNVNLQRYARTGIHQEPSREVEKGENQEHLFTHAKGFEHKISSKDIIALLEREPQMSKSTLNYCLSNR